MPKIVKQIRSIAQYNHVIWQFYGGGCRSGWSSLIALNGPPIASARPHNCVPVSGSGATWRVKYAEKTKVTTTVEKALFAQSNKSQDKNVRRPGNPMSREELR